MSVPSTPPRFARLSSAERRNGLHVFAVGLPPSITEPLELGWEVGTVAGDYLWASSWPVVSPTLRQLLEDADLSGWEAVAVSLQPELSGLGIDDYVALRVVGRSDPLDYTSARLERRGRADVLVGADAPNWDGSDLFYPAETRMLCLSPRARAVLTQAGLRDVDISGLDSLLTYPDEVAGEAQAPTPHPGVIETLEELDKLDLWIKDRRVRWRRARTPAGTVSLELDVLESSTTFVLTSSKPGERTRGPGSNTGVATCQGILWNEARSGLSVFLGDRVVLIAQEGPRVVVA